MPLVCVIVDVQGRVKRIVIIFAIDEALAPTQSRTPCVSVIHSTTSSESPDGHTDRRVDAASNLLHRLVGMCEDDVAIHFSHISGRVLIIDCPVGEDEVAQLVALPDPGVWEVEGVLFLARRVDCVQGSLSGHNSELIA